MNKLLLCMLALLIVASQYSAVAEITCKTMTATEGQIAHLAADPDLPDDYDYQWTLASGLDITTGPDHDDAGTGTDSQYDQEIDFVVPSYNPSGTNTYQIDLMVQSETASACVDYDCIILTVQPVNCPLADDYICEPYYDTAEPGDPYPDGTQEGPVVYDWYLYPDGTTANTIYNSNWVFTWNIPDGPVTSPFVSGSDPDGDSDQRTLTVDKSWLNMPTPTVPEACTTVTLTVTHEGYTILDSCSATICLYQYPDAQISQTVS